jgi:hypothetical protein
VFRREDDGQLVEEFMIDEMVAGQFKLYRREAFERIGGFVRQVMCGTGSTFIAPAWRATARPASTSRSCG